MEPITCQYDRIKREANVPLPTRTLDSTMADSSENEKSGAGTSGSKGTSPTDLMTEQLEATVSAGVKKRIDAMVAEVNKFNDLEKLLLYLKMPTGVSGFDSNGLKSTSPSLTVTRVEQTQAFNWIRSHLEECADTSLPKHEVYEDYRVHCDSAARRFLSPADFGKIMKNVFPRVKARRLGTRGNAKYCYSGLRKTCEVQPPLLPAMESPRKIGPNDLPRSSSSCKCSQEQQQTDLANTIVICEWAEKIFATRFQTTDELAHHLASNKLVSSSLASFTVLSGCKDVAPSRSLRLDAGTVKLPITPEERRKETQHQLQKKIQQRQLSRMKEEQTRLASERLSGIVKAGKSPPDDQKLLNRSHSMPNEMQMNARTESAVGGAAREHDATILNGSHCNGRQSDQQGGPTHTSGLQTNNNSNNNSNQPSAAGSTTSMMATVKESPNNKRRFTPIQPKTPVRDSAVKMSLTVNNLPSRQVVLVPNGAILNSKGQKIQQLPPGVQFIQLPAPSNGSTQQVATIPVQNIPAPKLVAPGTTKPGGSSPSTSRGQNIMVLSPGQVLQGSAVAGGLLVMNQSPSAGLAISGCAVFTGQKEPTKSLPSQSNNHMLQLQSDAGVASPQGVTSMTSAAYSDIIPSLTSPSLLSSPPVQHIMSPACPSSSTVLLKSANVETHKTSALSSNPLVSFLNSAALSKPTVTLSQIPSTSVTFSTLPMQKQISQALAGTSMSMVGSNEVNITSLDGRLASNAVTSDKPPLPISIANSASALLAILSDTANKEQGLDDTRGVRKAPRTNPPIGGTSQGHQPLGFAVNRTSALSQVTQQHFNTSDGMIAGGSKVSEDPQQALSSAVSSSGQKNAAATLPGKTQLEMQPTNSGLISILTAPVLETPAQKTSDHRQVQEGSQLTSSSGQTLPVYGFPIHTGNQSLGLAAQGIQIPIPVDIGNKRLALSSAQYVQPASVVPLQHRTILSQINEVTADVGGAVSANIMVKQEIENLGSRSVQQGIPVSHAVSFVNGVGPCTSVAVIQQPVSTDVQGRQSITPSYNSHSNTATPIPVSIESVPQSPNDSNKVYFTFMPIQQSTEQLGISVTSPSPVKPMQKPKPTFGTAQGSFATPNRKRRSSGSTRRPSISCTISSCLPPAVSRQITPTPSPSGSRCSTPLSPSPVSANNQSDSASMPPPSPAMNLSDLNQPQPSRGPAKHDPCSQILGQAAWGMNAVGNRKRNPSGPATLMQPAKQLSLDAASFLPEDLTELNIRHLDPTLDFSTTQQQYQRSHSVPLPAYQPVVLSQDRFLSNFPVTAEQRGVTVNNRTFGAKRNLTQALQEIQVTDEDFNPQEHFLDEGSDTALSDLLNADLQQTTQGQGSWVADPALSGMQPECSTDLSVDFSAERDSETELGLAQGLGDNSNSTASTLNEDIAAMDDMESNPVFQDFALPSWQQIGSSSNLATLECGM